MHGHRSTHQRSGEPRPALNWRAVAARVRLQIVDRNIALLAAGTAFWAILSIFPAIIAMVTIYGLVASPEQVTKEVTKLGGSLSPSTREVVTDWLAGLTNTSHQQLGVGLVVGLVAVLWALSSGVRTLIKAITAAYEQEEDARLLQAARYRAAREYRSHRGCRYCVGRDRSRTRDTTPGAQRGVADRVRRR